MSSILILGCGVLGSALSDAYSSLGISSVCISLRSFYSLESLQDNKYKLIIDCMDPSSNSIPNYSKIYSKITSVRAFVAQNFIFTTYCYMSSANVYIPTCSLINEFSATYSPDDLHQNSYISNKLLTEIYLRSQLYERLVVLRLVSLWSGSQTIKKDGFFADLLSSRKSRSYLSSRDGDDNVISFMSYDDASKIITFLSSYHFYHFNILNITSERWSTRKCLKQRLDFSEDSSIKGLRIISSVISDKLPHFEFSALS